MSTGTSTVVIAGGHGKIALLLARLLADRGDTVRALVRNPDHDRDVRDAGAEPVHHDLEGDEDLGAVVAGADAVVFAAGAGPDSGVDRKWAVDRDGALKLASAATASGVPRYVMVSAMGAAEGADTGDEVFDAYLAAKWQADEGVLASGLDVVVVRPGHLSDDPGTGRVRLQSSNDEGTVPRADVAAVLAAILAGSPPSGSVVELVAGDTPVAEAVAAL